MTVSMLRRLLAELDGNSYVYLIQMSDTINSGKKLSRVVTMKDGKSTWVKLVAE
jgi:hypothetical protein